MVNDTGHVVVGRMEARSGAWGRGEGGERERERERDHESPQSRSKIRETLFTHPLAGCVHSNVLSLVTSNREPRQQSGRQSYTSLAEDIMCYNGLEPWDDQLSTHGRTIERIPGVCESAALGGHSEHTA